MSIDKANLLKSMLLINVTSTENSPVKFSDFKQSGLPGPLSGVDAEINGDLILKFADEEEAIEYSRQLEDLSFELNNKSSLQNIAINDIILAIRNDEFVQSYLQNK
jgi:hypothetical protein